MVSDPFVTAFAVARVKIRTEGVLGVALESALQVALILEGIDFIVSRTEAETLRTQMQGPITD